EGPPILFDRLDPTGGTDDDPFLGEPVEQPLAVDDLLRYQCACIHRNTPSGTWLTASDSAFACASVFSSSSPSSPLSHPRKFPARDSPRGRPRPPRPAPPGSRA